MTDSTNLKIQMLEKIGAPLAQAVGVLGANDQDPIQGAQAMAKMLSQSVEMSIHLSQVLGVQEEEGRADAIRVALAALAAPLLGGFYKQHDRLPEEDDLKKLNESFEAVLSFAENFKAAQEQQSRLVTLGEETILLDDTQTTLVTLQALTPVINAIAEFPFGQSKKKLLQDVTHKLEQYAQILAEKAALGDQDKLSQMLIFKSLAHIYAHCHHAQTARLMNAGDDMPEQPSTDMVWDAFADQLAMVEAVIVPGADTDTGIEVPVQKAADQTEEQEDNGGSAGEAVKPAQAQPSTTPPAGGGANPMGFFKAPGAAAAPETAPEQPVEQQQPAQADVPPPPATPPTAPLETPDAPPPSDSGQASANPMGFFKPGAKPAQNPEDGNDDKGGAT